MAPRGLLAIPLASGSAALAGDDADAPAVDAARSTVVEEIDAAMLHGLPLGRSLQEALLVVPGVYGRIDTARGVPGAGALSSRGEGWYGNDMRIDGLSTRDRYDRAGSRGWWRWDAYRIRR